MGTQERADDERAKLCRCFAAGERCRNRVTGTGDYCAFCRAWGCEQRERSDEEGR